jgi:hypothetical protein
MTAISTPGSTTSGDGDYPLTFAIDYPDRSLLSVGGLVRLSHPPPIVDE